MSVKCHKCHSDNTDTAKFCSECATPLQPSQDISVTKTIETPVEEFTRGTLFSERYEIIEELGKGGMGNVYRVEDTRTKEDIALKLIKPEIASDKKTIERFRNELTTARKIRHKNVCGMYDLGEHGGAHFITMEYVSGEDLKSLIRRVKRLDAATAIAMAKQVCEGLSEAHRLGVVHRDLKSNNIMIDKEGNARIMDFGIARSLEAKGLTGEGIIIGTPEYMSPEQVEGKEIDQRSDIYSLGVIMYEMVTGRVPFEGETPLGIAMKHKSEMPKDPKELNPQIRDDLNVLILKCLEKDRKSRYRSAEELHAELINIEKGIPTTERVIPKRKPITSKEITVTFGLKKLLIPALIFFAIVIAAVIIWRIIPRKEPVLAPKIDNSIAVISFENQTGDKAYNYLQKAIPNLLITNLENTGYLYVVTWERMLDLLKQIGKKDVEVIDRDLGFKLCRTEGIEAIVLGSFIKAGDMFAIDVKILDVETKKLLKSTNTKGEGVESILKTQIDDLSKEISQGIGIAKEKIEEVKMRIADVTTTSMEAYKYFLRGREDFYKLYHGEAQPSFQKAIEIDSTFAMAYLYLGLACDNLGDYKSGDEAYEKAKAFSGRASEKERLYIDARYARAIEKNPEKRFQILKQIAKKFPKEKQVYRSLGRYYADRKLFDEAVEEYNKSLDLDPNYGDIFNELGLVYLEMENYEKAIEYFEKYASAFPGDANPLDSMAWTYFRMGKMDEAMKKFKEALEIKPDFHWSLFGRGYINAFKENYSEAMKWTDQYIDKAASVGRRAKGYILKGFYQYWLGKLDQSLNSLSKGRDLAEEVGNWYWQYIAEWMKGVIYYVLGELELSQKYFKGSFDLAKEHSPQFISSYTARYYFNLGLVELKQGQIDSTKSRLAEIKSLLTKMDPQGKVWISYWNDYLTGEALLAQDSFDKTIEVIGRISPLKISWTIEEYLFLNLFNHRDVLVRAYRKKGEIDKTIAEYESLIAVDQKSRKSRLIFPKYYYSLAKLYEQKGWEGKATEHYQKFLSLWKDANPGIPEVEDARKRLAGLRD